MATPQARPRRNPPQKEQVWRSKATLTLGPRLQAEGSKHSSDEPHEAAFPNRRADERFSHNHLREIEHRSPIEKTPSHFGSCES